MDQFKAADGNTEELAESARRGDRAAFERLVEQYRPALEARVRSRLGDQLALRTEVADVVQETLLKALQSIDRFCWQGEESFLAWLTGIAEHLILNLARRSGRDPQVPLEEDPSSGGASPSRALRSQERFDRLRHSLDLLSPEYRKVILLARVEGLPLDEVARRLKRTPNAVSHLLLRALRKLRSTFGDTECFDLPPRSLLSGTDHEKA